MWYRLQSKLPALLLMLCLSVMMKAQPGPQGIFNEGAAEFVTGSKSIAEQIVLRGLEEYPNDDKLNKLLEKIREEQEKQDQQNQNQDQQQQDQNQEDQDGDQGEDGQEQEEQQQGGDGQQDQRRDENGERQPMPQEGKISRQDAERLLEALSREEQEVQKKLNEKKVESQPIRTEKDW